MSYAHGQGVVHRDLKPANILVAAREEGQRDAYVVDFGLARDISAAAAYDSLLKLLIPRDHERPTEPDFDTWKTLLDQAK